MIPEIPDGDWQQVTSEEYYQYSDYAGNPYKNKLRVTEYDEDGYPDEAFYVIIEEVSI